MFKVSKIFAVSLFLFSLGSMLNEYARSKKNFLWTIFFLKFKMFSQPKSVPLNGSPSKTSASKAVTPGFIGSITFGRDMNGNFLCPFPSCGKSFANNTNARRHFDSAHGGAEFKCQICQSSFNRKDVLKSHAMKKHGLNEAMAKAMLTC